MNQTNINKIYCCDLIAILNIENRCYQNPWNLQNLSTETTQPFSFNFKLSIKNKIVGYCFSSLIFENLQINNLCIDRQHQKNGFGFLLMNHILTQAKNLDAKIVTLEVNVNNSAAILLYEKLGFHINKIKNFYYSNGDNAQTMLLML